VDEIVGVGHKLEAHSSLISGLDR